MNPSYNNFGAGATNPMGVGPIGSGNVGAEGMGSGNVGVGGTGMGSIGSGNAGAGQDIVLNDGRGARKTKRGWFVAAMVLFVVAIIAGIAAVVVLSRGDGGGDVASTPTRESFNIFSNYLIYGDNSTKKLDGVYKKNNEYAVESAVIDRDMSYFSELNGYWQDFLVDYNADETLSTSNALVGIVEKEGYLLDFVIKYAEIGELTEDRFLADLASGNVGNVSEYINSKYASILNEELEESKIYVDALISKYGSMAAMYAEIVDAGCLMGNGLIDGKCADSMSFSDDVFSNYVTAMSNESLGIVDTMIEELESNSWKISERLEDVNK